MSAFECFENFEAIGVDLKIIDLRLEDIVNRMFQRCFEDKKFKQVTRHLEMSEGRIN